MTDADRAAPLAVHERTVACCEAIHHSRPEVFEETCHERFATTAPTGSEGTQHCNKAGDLARAAGRAPAPGAPSGRALPVDVAGEAIARVHLWVDVPPPRFEDHLGFGRRGGDWKLITKVCRTLDGPAMEG